MNKRDQERDFMIPQEEADKLKNSSNAAANVFLVIITSIVISLVGIALYWTQIAGNDLPIKVNVDIEEAEQISDVL